MSFMFFYVADGHIVDVDRVNQLNKKQFKIECCMGFQIRM